MSKITEFGMQKDGIYKVTTEHGTYYILDFDNGKGKRVPAEGRNALRADNDWFKLYRVRDFKIGEPMHLEVRGIADDDWYTWRRTTIVSSIEKIEGH
jgi:hypothetical protein